MSVDSLIEIVQEVLQKAPAEARKMFKHQLRAAIARLENEGKLDVATKLRGLLQEPRG